MAELKKYFYPLYKPQDKVLFKLLFDSAQSNQFPEIIGTDEELIQFIKLLITSQKMKDYRKFWDTIIKSYQLNKFDLEKLIEFGNTLEITKGIDKSWAIFKQDKEISILIDQLSDSKTSKFKNRELAGEFITRFILTQLLQDWRGPLMATCITILESEEINFKQLNNLLKIWDLNNIWNNDAK